jgi:transcriptional regulator of acetoin/glycerol metabolism
MSPASLATSTQAAAHPGARHSLLAQARQQLLAMDSSHALVPSGLAPWLWRSWQRCVAQGRHPAQTVEFEAVGPHALRHAQDKHQLLLQAARPVMTQLVAAVGAMRYFCLLTDAQGLALEVQGPVDHSDLRALAVGRVGVDLSERGVGTSAIGATLAELSPVWLHRQEHFFDDLRDYSCAGAPVFGPQGECLGMLDITGIDVPERPELLLLALRCARAIEDRLLRALPHTLLLRVNWPGGPLGQEGEGFRYAMMGLDGGRLNIAACSLGGARLALETAQAYVATRTQFGKALAEFQNTQFKLADMATQLEAARLMVLRGAWAIDTGHPEKTKWCAMAKRLATDACFQIADEALQLHGGYGYLKDYPLERIVRDLRVHRILEGTNEIMRVITAREMMRQ